MPSLQTLSLIAHDIKDSRGRPTLRVEAALGDERAYGDVPAGASKGRDEARTVPVADARANVTHHLLPLLQSLALDPTAPAALLAADRAMAEAAGEGFAVLGANATLPVSRALWALGAKLRREPLWRTLAAGMAGPAREGPPPRGLFNVFNGGLHALRAGEQLGRDRIDLQEIMVVPKTTDMKRALAMADAIDEALSERLGRVFGQAAVSRGDEAGLSVLGLGDSLEAVAHVVAAIGEAGLVAGEDCQLALDVAAGSLYRDGAYHLAGQALTGAEMVAWLLALVDRYQGLFVSIEDGLDEDDWANWSELRRKLAAVGVKTVGDDLFVTQHARLERGIACQAADAILIKVNQNGTVGGTLSVIERAAEAGLVAIVSHRSGETLDDSIADLAVGTGAWGLKSGAPQPPSAYPNASTWTRRGKYLRLVDIAAGQ